MLKNKFYMEMETRGIRGVSADNKEDDNNGKKDN